MKYLSILLLITFIATSCGSNYEDAAGSSGLFAGHKPTEDAYTLIPPTEKIYLENDVIEIKLEHPFNVTVTGNPRVPIDLGGSTVYATYISGSGSKILSFHYTVLSGDLDLDGIVQGSAIDLNSGTLMYNDGTTTQATSVDVPNDSLSGVKVDAVAPTVAITPASILPNIYMNNQIMQVIVLFPEFVDVTGTPQVELDVGGSTVFADYITGTGGTTLIFQYTIDDADLDFNGVDIVSFNLNGGTIKDLPGNAADLSFTSPTNAVAALVDGDTPYVVNYVTPTDGTYSPGQDIEFSLVFSEAVDVAGGTPFVNLDLEGNLKEADYLSGSGTDTLVFKYTAITGDVDLTGIEIDNTINLNGATVQDSGTTNTLLSMAPPLTPNVLVDGTLPTVATITPPTDNTYTLGQELYFTFKYNVAVDVIGIPRIKIILNSHDPTPVYADFSSGTGTDSLIFRYVVTTGHEDLDGIALESPIDLNGGSIIGYNAVTADNMILTQVGAIDTSNIFVDDKQPAIISVTPPADQNYTTGMDVDLTVKFSEPVTVTGLPKLSLDVGGSTIDATYTSGSGTTDLIFRYTVGGGDLDDNGIAFANNLIDLSGGTILDAVSLAALLDFTAVVPDVSGINVNYDPPVIISVIAPLDKYYKESEVLGFTVNTNVLVNISAGTPRIELDIGGQQAYADYISGTGTTALYFALSVPVGLEDHDGINIVSPIDANGATLRDVNLNDLDLTYTAPDLTNVKVDSLVPYVVSLTKPVDGTFILNDNLDFILNYNENIDVADATPRLVIDINGTTRYADYVSGTGSSALTFTYTIQAGEEDTNGISFVGTTIDLNGATIKDIGTNDTNINLDAFTALPSLAAVLVDGIVPTITSITPAPNNTYIIGDTLDFIVNYDDNVTITATPRVPLTLTSGTVYADYLSGTGTNAITFRYTVIVMDDDADGLDIVSPLDLNGIGLIQDVNGNDSDLSHTPAATPGIIVDGIIPTVTIDTTAVITNTNYLTYNMTGTCSENGELVNIDIGGVSDSDTCTGLVWSTTTDVTAASESADNTVADVAITADHDDAGGNSAVQATDTQIKDTILPTVSSNLIAANTYIIGDAIDLVLTFSENVTPAGSEQVDLTIGAATVVATQSATTANTITYSYTVLENDLDTDGLANAATITIGGGSIVDAVGNALTNSIPTTAYPAAFVDGVKPNVTNVTIAANTYYIGDNLDIVLTFDDNVTIAGGSPEIPLTFETMVGGPKAVYSAGTGTTSVTFRYVPVNGNEDTNGIDLAAAIALAGSTVQDVNGNDSYLTLSSTNFPAVLIDAILPTVTIDATSVITNSNYLTYNMTGTCSENGQAVNVDIGGVSDSATCAALVWSTTTDVTAASESADNTIADVAITADHSDAGANAAVQATDTQIKDTILPTISTNTIAANTYIIGDAIDMVVTFSEDVTPVGSESIDLTIGVATRNATQSATTANSITYSYIVVENDLDSDGIAGAASITGGAGIVDAVGNAFGNVVPTTAFATELVDGVRPTISSVTIAANTYYATETLSVSVLFDDNVEVATSNPEIDLTFGTMVGGPKAVYSAGTGTTTLTFDYTVATGNEDTDGIDLAAAISLAGATIQDTNGNDSYLTLSSTNFPAVLIDAILPTVTIDATSVITNSNYLTYNMTGTCSENGQAVNVDIGGVSDSATCAALVWSTTTDVTAASESADNTVADVAITADHSDAGANAAVQATDTQIKDTILPTISTNTIAANTYIIGDTIDMVVTFSEDVTPVGTESIDLTIGAATRNATQSATTANSITYSYTVVENDFDSDGIAGAVSITGGVGIVDAVGNAFGNVVPTTAFATEFVDGVKPNITNVVVAADTYGDGEQIDVVITYDDNVTFAGGIPEISFTFDTEVLDPKAIYASGSGTNTLTFSYIVTTGNEDTDGLDLSASISLAGATAKDDNGNDAYLSLSTTNFPSALVDAIAPLVAISTPADLTYINIASDSAVFVVMGTCNVPGQTVTIKVDGTAASSPSGLLCDGASFTGTIDSTGIAEGARVFTAEITDLGSNTGVSPSINITKDTVAPIIALDVLADVAISNEATYTVSGTCDEDTATVNLAFGSLTDSSITCSSGTFSKTNWDVSTEGDNAAIFVTADITDAAGNPSTQATTNVLKDTVAPILAILTPADLDIIGVIDDSATFIVNGTCDENTQTVDVKIDGVSASSQVGFVCDGTNFTGTIDTTGLVDGTYAFTAELADAVGNVGTSSTNNIDKDTVPPSVAISSPIDSAYINIANDSAMYAISGTCNENSQTVIIKVDGVNASSPSGFLCDGTNFSGTIDSTTIAEGAFVFTAYLEDTGGNNTTSTGINITRDVTAPTIALSTPADTTVIGTIDDSVTYTVDGTCNENTQTVSIEIDSFAATSQVGFVCDGTNFTGTIDTTGLADATYAFTAIITDIAGNESTSATNSIEKDATPPTVAISVPADLSYLNISNDSATFTVSGTCNEATETVVIKVDGVAATSPSGFICDGTNFTGTIDTTGLSEAAIAFTAELTDAGSNTGTSSTNTITKDITAPTIALVTPANLSTIGMAEDSATFAVSGTCDENTQTVSFEIDAAAASSQTGFVCDGTNFTGTIDTTGLADATYAFTAKISDTAGNETTSTSNSVEKDATAPTVAITAPADSSYINIATDSATFTVNGTCNENTQTVVVKVDGVAATSPSGFVCDGTNFTGTIDTTGLAEGSRAFTAELTDSSSNTGTSATNNVTRDVTSPTIALDVLADVASANETSYAVTGTCDENTATVNINFGAQATTATCSSGTFSKTAWDISAEGDNASILITIDMNDLAGNPATQATTNVAKDTSAPTVAIVNPADSSTITSATDSATFTVDGTCDEATETVIIKVNGSAAASPSGFVCDGTNFTGTIDTTGLTYAAHSFTAELSDSVGNTGTSVANSVEKINYLVSITSPAIINLANETAYTVSGTCSTNTETVTVTVGGSVIDTPTCTGGAFTTASMNVSGPADNAALSVDADHGTASDSTTTIKDTLIPTITINALANIAIANESSFPVTGTCSEDGENIDITIGTASASGSCSSGTYSINVNTGSVSDGTSISVLADHQDAAGNDATQSSTTTDKDATAPTLAITYSPDITGANETAYSISGSCSENGVTVNVDINGLGFTPNCSGGAWSVGPTDVSSRSDNAALPISIDQTDSFGNIGNGSTTVDKNTSTPTVAITNSPDITQANLTSYIVSGTCSENGTSVSVDVGGITKNPNCSSGTWATSQIDATGLSDGTVNITADHSTAPQASTSVNKDTTSATVTISSAPNITISNEAVYVASGTCSENGTNVDVYIDTLNYLVSCGSGTWTTGLVDVSSLSDGTGLFVTADHSTATQASTTINKETATPTVASLSVSTTLTESADITWSLNDPGGFTIDDYTVNYRIKGSPTWLTFADGVSLLTSSTVTGLVATTTYEFRVRVEYDSGSNSEWSNTAEGETQPDDPIFGPYAAMNVGGSTTTTVVAHEDGTDVTLNGGALVSLNKGQTHNFTSVQFDVIDANKPIYTAGRRGSTTTSQGANITWNPSAWAGKNFSFNATRTNPQKLEVYAIEDTFVEVKQGSTVLDSATITAGSGTTLSWSVYGSYQVVATGSIIAYHMSYNGTNMHDPKPLLPAHTEVIGFPSNSMRLTANNDGTNYNLIHSESSTASGSLNKADVIQVNPQGGASLYTGNSLIISADKKISGASFADSNGLCAAPFMPTNLMKTKYAVNVDSDYAAFASKVAGTIEVRNAANTLITTLTLTRSGGNSNAPFKARMANPNAGYRFIATVPVAGWYQPRTNTGAGDQDETILYGTN